MTRIDLIGSFVDATSAASVARASPTQSFWDLLTNERTITTADLVVQLVVVVLSIWLIWAGLKKLEVEGLAKTIISVLDFLVLIASVILLHWTGVILAMLANVIGFLIWSMQRAAEQQSLLVRAAIEGGFTKEEMYGLHARLQADRSVSAGIMNIPLAKLMLYLSERHRTINEMEHMAAPIVQLWKMHDVADLRSLVSKFDRLLRLYGHPASEALDVAKMLQAATQRAAATFEEMLDSTIAVVDRNWHYHAKSDSSAGTTTSQADSAPTPGTEKP